MRARIAAIGLLFAGGMAAADVPQPASKVDAPPGVVPIELADLPAQCKAIGKQANAARVQAALSARISLANCLADTRLAALALLDCEESVRAVEEAVQPSFELLDGVSAQATDDVTKIVAERAKAELYQQMTMRMRATVPPAGATEASIAMHEARKGILDGLLAPWYEQAAAAYERIVAIAKARPALERDPVAGTAVRMAKDRLRLHVAARGDTAPDAAEPDGTKTDVNEELR